MTIVRKSSEEIDNRITPDRWNKFKKAAQREPDMTDPDSPDFSEEIGEAIKRLGRPKKDLCKQLLTLRLEPFTLHSLRRSGKGWQTRVSNWIDEGVRKGAL